MDNITISLENVRVFRDKQSNEIVSIETENGHIDRYMCERSNNGRSNQLFGCDLPVSGVRAKHSGEVV